MTEAKRIGLITAFLAITLGGRSVYGTTWASASGNLCHKDTGMIGYTNAGARNIDVESSDFLCPLPLGTQSDYPVYFGNVALSYFDRNDEYQFRCKVCQASSDTSVSCSELKYTCQTYGGCYTTTYTDYVGTGWMIWDTTDLGSGVYENYLTSNTTVWCHVPPYDEQTGYSGMLTYWATFQ